MIENAPTDYQNLELIRNNPSRDGEAYRGVIHGQDTLVKINTDPHERTWLHYEASILQRLSDSPHVPGLYDIQDSEDNKTYLAEQFVPGVSLRAIIGAELDERRTIEPLSPNDAAGIINRIGAAELDLIQHGVMYRDLQTDHIIFADDDHRAVFVDLGLASDDSYTDENGVRKWRQTPHSGLYATMSPSELRGEDMSEADVVYRLAVLYHLTLTGKLPFDHPQQRQDINEWVNNPTFELSDKLTPEGRELFENALLNDPQRQIKSVELFLHHINRLKAHTIKTEAIH